MSWAFTPLVPSNFGTDELCLAPLYGRYKTRNTIFPYIYIDIAVGMFGRIYLRLCQKCVLCKFPSLQYILSAIVVTRILHWFVCTRRTIVARNRKVIYYCAPIALGLWEFNLKFLVG